MARDQKFEIPQELRELAEENVERARKLYLQFMDGVGRAMTSLSSASSDVATKRKEPWCPIGIRAPCLSDYFPILIGVVSRSTSPPNGGSRRTKRLRPGRGAPRRLR